MYLNHSPERPAWERTLLKAIDDALSPGATCATEEIDFDVLESILASATKNIPLFVPVATRDVENVLRQLDIPIVGNLIHHAIEEDFGRFDNYAVSFYQKVFSKPHCALYLAPSLVGEVFFSHEAPIVELSAPGGILEVFRKGLGTRAFAGLVAELKRHALLEYGSEVKEDHRKFSAYASALAESMSIDALDREPFQGNTALSKEIERPLFEAHAQSALKLAFLQGAAIPVEFTNLLIGAGSAKSHFLRSNKFSDTEIATWATERLAAMTVKCEELREDIRKLEDFRSKPVSGFTPQSGLEFLAALVNLEVPKEPPIEIEQRRIQAGIRRMRALAEGVLHFLKFVNDDRPTFKFQHRQDGADPSPQQGKDGLFPYAGHPKSTYESEPKLKPLTRHLTDFMIAFQSVLGHSKTPVTLMPAIPDLFSRLMRGDYNCRMEQYTDYSDFYTGHVNSCMLRFIETHDLRSAASLMLMAPSFDSVNGITRAPEIQRMLYVNSEPIQDSIAEVSEALATLIQRPIVRFQRDKIERKLCDLRSAFTDLISGSEIGPKLRNGIKSLISALVESGIKEREGHDMGMSFPGIESAARVLSWIDRESASDILKRALSDSHLPKVKEEFELFLKTCDGEAAKWLQAIGKSRDVRHLDEDSPIQTAVDLYFLLPAAFRAELFRPESAISWFEFNWRGLTQRRNQQDLAAVLGQKTGIALINEISKEIRHSVPTVSLAQSLLRVRNSQSVPHTPAMAAAYLRGDRITLQNCILMMARPQEFAKAANLQTLEEGESCALNLVRHHLHNRTTIEAITADFRGVVQFYKHGSKLLEQISATSNSIGDRSIKNIDAMKYRRVERLFRECVIALNDSSLPKGQLDNLEQALLRDILQECLADTPAFQELLKDVRLGAE